MFLRNIVEKMDALEPGTEFRKRASLFLNISGVFVVVITVVFGILHLQSAETTGSSGMVTAAFTVIRILLGLLITGIVGVMMVLLFWNRSKKIAALAGKLELTFSSISGNLTRLFGEAAFIKLNGLAILCLVYLLFSARELGGTTLILLALSFLFYFIGIGFLQFAYVISDISTHRKQTETTQSEGSTVATVSETGPSEPPIEESTTMNTEEHSPESGDVTATTVTEAATSLEGESTMNEPIVNNEEHQAEIDAETDSDIYTSKYWWFVIGFVSGPIGILSAFLKPPVPMPNFLAGKSNPYKIAYAATYRAKGRRTQVIFSIIGCVCLVPASLLLLSSIAGLLGGLTRF